MAKPQQTAPRTLSDQIDAAWPARPEQERGGLSEAATPFLHRPVRTVVIPLRRPGKIGVRLNRIGGADLIIPDIAALPRALRDRTVKRALDLFLAAVALVLLALPMGMIAFALRVEGGGAIFAQPRVGRDRTRFLCLKFRTMRPDAESRLQTVLAASPAAREEWRIHQKLSNDPRITRLGRFLRATSLDELPQLVNVMRGDMSLVGPRPIVAPEIAGYPADRAYYASEDFDDYAGCLPGMTGLWQISVRHRAAHSERVRLDTVYARNWSVLLDLAILWRTVRVVLARTGR